MKLSMLSTVFHLLRWLVAGYRYRDCAISFSATRPKGRVHWQKLLRLDTASAVDLTRKAESPAYTRSPKWSRLTAVPGFTVTWRIIHSIAMLNRAGARTQLCLTPEVVLSCSNNKSENSLSHSDVNLIHSQNFARTCIFTAARTLLNVKVIGQRSKSFFVVSGSKFTQLFMSNVRRIVVNIVVFRLSIAQHDLEIFTIKV